jgi:lipopolysaccharide/colanic/teichoic acid biosynthesis glycosyltransferase
MRVRYKYPAVLFFDLAFIALALTLSLLIKGADLRRAIVAYQGPMLIFTAVWLSGSIIFRKYQISREVSTQAASLNLLKMNVMLFLGVTFVIFLMQQDYSRGVLIGAALFTTTFELIATYAYMLDRHLSMSSKAVEAYLDQTVQLEPEVEQVVQGVELDGRLRETILEESGPVAFDFIRAHLARYAGHTLFISTTTRFNILTQPDGVYHSIVNLHRSNDIPRINKFFETVNQKLPPGGLFMCCVETAKQRKARLLKKYPPILNYIYYPFDYVFKRVFPKFPGTKWLYFLITRGNNRVLSRAEALGRLYSCGFEVIGEENSNGRLCVAARKIKEPAFDMDPTYGPLVKLRRYGKDGKIIGVFKMRTMYPYSEYLQDFVYNHHRLDHGGKFKNDFRVTGPGRLMRKFWIDELPMIFNLLKGDLKVVGVRPLSKHYFSLYTPELQQRRIKHKPGLVPPFYVDMPKTLDEVMDSERRYLDAYEQHPWKTDWRYFWAAMNNIFLKRARSS